MHLTPPPFAFPFVAATTLSVHASLRGPTKFRIEPYRVVPFDLTRSLTYFSHVLFVFLSPPLSSPPISFTFVQRVGNMFSHRDRSSTVSTNFSFLLSSQKGRGRRLLPRKSFPSHPLLTENSYRTLHPAYCCSRHSFEEYEFSTTLSKLNFTDIAGYTGFQWGSATHSTYLPDKSKLIKITLYYRILTSQIRYVKI